MRNEKPTANDPKANFFTGSNKIYEKFRLSISLAFSVMPLAGGQGQSPLILGEFRIIYVSKQVCINST